MNKFMITFLLLNCLLTSYICKKYPILAEDNDVICETSFEDDDFSMFTSSGSDEVLEISKENPKTGDNCLVVTKRTCSWNGNQFSLDKTYVPGGQYLVKA